MSPETSELRSFVSVCDLGSVSGAATELGLPRATVSRRLARLEARLGVRLIHRTTRSLRLTDSGETFYTHARSILDAVELATLAVTQNAGRPSGLLRVSVPPVNDSGFATMLIEFSEGFPEVELEVIATTAHQDLFAEKIDVALRATGVLPPGLIARRLTRSSAVAVAAPAYLERAGVPKSVDALTEHRCLVGFAQGARRSTHWPLLDGGKVRVRASLATNSVELLFKAVLRGRGIALLPRTFCADALTDGSIVAVLPDIIGAATDITLVYRDRQLPKPAVRAFVDHAVEWANAGGLRPSRR